MLDRPTGSKSYTFMVISVLGAFAEAAVREEAVEAFLLGRVVEEGMVCPFAVVASVVCISKGLCCGIVELSWKGREGCDCRAARRFGP